VRQLQLVGYTADLLHLVFTDTDEGGGRFKAPIDEDFVATLTEVLELVDPDAAPLGSLLGERSPHPPPAPEPDGIDAGTGDDGDEPPVGPRGVGPLAGMAAAVKWAAADNGEVVVGSDRPRPSKLAPREIQALLRAGQGVRSVAKLADTDEWWVRRWLPPIEAERDQVLQGVWSCSIAKTRLGVSADPVGEAVEKNLAAKGVRPDDPSVEWSAARREGDAHWKVILRYRSRGRAQRAVWHFSTETGELLPRNNLAVDIAWTRPRRGATRATADGARRPSRRAKAPGGVKKAGAKKVAAKKAAATKGEKKAAAKKATAKKAAAKKAAAKKAASKRGPAKKSGVKRTAPAPAAQAGTGTGDNPASR